MKELTVFKKTQVKINIIDAIIEVYKNTDITKTFGLTNNFIGQNNLGKRIIDKLTEVTIEVLLEEKEILLD